MKEIAPTLRYERRWPVMMTIVAVILLLALLPGPIRLMPLWFTYVLGGAVLVPIAAVGLTAARPRWHRVERAVTLLFVVITAAGTLANLGNLLIAMAQKPANFTGLQLLASSVGVWVTNVLTFSLLYWQMDRGGPDARAQGTDPRPDWLFPQSGVPDQAPPGWRPVFVDYLFLAYSTATAFSTTEVAPLTTRAKLLMMLESTISLVTIVVVASRAINIFGS